MNKELFGTFIATERKKAGLTQQALADRIYVTDKAVSKWERGLCYPDLTIMENLAEALGLTMTELMSCERSEEPQYIATQEDIAVKSTLSISGEAIQTQKKKHRLNVIFALIILVAIAAIVYLATNVSEVRKDFIVNKQAVDENYYVYIEEDNHLLRLRCADQRTFDAVKDDGVTAHDMEIRWNRITYQGILESCVPDEATIAIGGMDSMIGSAIDFGALFGFDCVWQQYEQIYPDPEREGGFLYTYRYFINGDGSDYFAEGIETTLVVVEDCRNTMAFDYDNDGVAELFVLTRYYEEPYMLYEFDGTEITKEFVTEVPDSVLEWFEMM